MSLKIIQPLPVVPVQLKPNQLKTGNLYRVRNNQSALDGVIVMSALVSGGSCLLIVDRGTALPHPERFYYEEVTAELHIKE